MRIDKSPVDGAGRPASDERGPKAWRWDGNIEAPSLTPSLFVYKGTPSKECHFYLTAGVLHFKDECFHALRNKSVPLPPLP